MSEADDRHTRRVGTNVLLVRDGKILLGRRANTGWADGLLGIPGGHLEAGETARQAAVREIEEEAGVRLTVDRLVFYATGIVKSTHEYVYQEFYVELLESEEPIIGEPESCSELVWCDPRQLPDDVIDTFRTVIEQAYLGGQSYFEVGY